MAESLENQIRSRVTSVLDSPTFSSWLSTEQPATGDLIVLNNSFIYRDGVKTTKNALYLAFQCGASGPDKKSLAVARAPSFNVDFKAFSGRSKGNAPLEPLHAQVADQLALLGSLVFVLIGKIDRTTECEVSINHSLAKLLRLAPAGKKNLILDGEAVVLNELPDLDTLWSWLEQEALTQGRAEGSLPKDLEGPLADAYDRLQAEAYSVVRIPGKNIRSIGGSILGILGDTIAKQCDEYERSLKRARGREEGHGDAFNNMLRIAYNFAHDTRAFVELVVSICDLKPLVMWITIVEHLQLAEAFRHLPWAKSKKKPSLSHYADTISAARNHAFHDFLPLTRSIQVDVQDVSLKATRLQLFSPYARKKENALEYEDQEIVELLTQFTRAPETPVAFSFWERNLQVMRSAAELMNSTGRALAALRRAQAAR